MHFIPDTTLPLLNKIKTFVGWSYRNPKRLLTVQAADQCFLVQETRHIFFFEPYGSVGWTLCSIGCFIYPRQTPPPPPSRQTLLFYLSVAPSSWTATPNDWFHFDSLLFRRFLLLSGFLRSAPTSSILSELSSLFPRRHLLLLFVILASSSLPRSLP